MGGEREAKVGFRESLSYYQVECGDGGVQMSEQGKMSGAAGAEVDKKHSVVK